MDFSGLSELSKLPHTFFIIDTETTGLKPETADAIEVSAVKVELNAHPRTSGRRFNIVSTFDTFINPEYPLPEDIVKFNEANGTGINDELLSKAPLVDEAARKLHAFLGQYRDSPVMVAHNAPFDLGFLDKMYGKVYGTEFDVKRVIDTLALARSAFRYKVDCPNHRLGTLHEMTDGKYSGWYQNRGNTVTAHTAISDCIMTLDVLNMLCDKNAEYERRTHRGIE